MRQIYLLKKCLLSAVCFVLFLSHTKAQVSGIKNIPGDYSSIAAAIADLNTSGVGSGGVTFNVNAGYTETITATLSLTATGTISNPIVFQKSGVGANPLITSYTGGTGTPGSAVQDGIWRLSGSDYVTIDGIDLTENAANTANPSTMEYGYALYKASASDGCQHVLIKNCVITLSNFNNASGSSLTVNGSVGISVMNATFTAAATRLSPTVRAGSNSYNRFYSNTIKNCNIGIALIGFGAMSPFTVADTLNDIGGTSAATGNQILNFGVSDSSLVNSSAGIQTLAQYGLNVSYNTINNSNGSGTNYSSVLRGIYINTATSASYDCNYNTITVKGGGTTSTINVMELSGGNTPASNTVNVIGNTIENCTYTTNARATFSGINVLNFNVTRAAENLNINNNVVRNNTVDAFAGSMYGIAWSNPANVNVTNNQVSGFSITGTGTIYGLFGGDASNEKVNSNTIYDLSNMSVSSSNCSIYGIYQNNEGNTKEYKNNTVYNLSITGSTATANVITGIHARGSTAVLASNIVHSLNGVAQTITGISLPASGVVCSVYQNKIYDFSSSAASGLVSGIGIGGNTLFAVCNIYNNLIGNLKAPAVSANDAIRGIDITASGPAIKVSYNTIFLSASSSGINFGTTGIYHTVNSNADWAPLSLINNVIVNTSVPSGTGKTVAYRRSGTTLNNYHAASGYNLFYADTPGSNNLIFYDGMNADQTIEDYKARVATRDSTSVSQRVVFLDTVGVTSDFLVPDPSVATVIESGGTQVAGIITDFNGDNRYGNPGYSGTGSAPDMGAYEKQMIFKDMLPPVIGHTTMVKSSVLTSLELTATIRDITGVPSVSFVPVLYFKRNSTGTYVPVNGSLISGTTTDGTWSFNISYSMVGGVVLTDVIYYFIVAQDASANVNISSLPAGAMGADVNNITSYPATPYSYEIVTGKSGPYLIGANQIAPNYTTLTQAITDMASSELTGDITLLFQSDYSAASEPAFPIVLPDVSFANSAYTITIRPDNGVNTIISDSNESGIIKLSEKAHHYIIDGSNNGTDSRNLFIHNKFSSSASTVIWFEGLPSGQGVRNSVVKNVIVKGGSQTNTTGILVGGSTNSITSGGFGHNQLLIANNVVYNCNTAVGVCGTSPSGIANNITIEKNILGTDSVSFYNRQYGVYIDAANNVRVNENKIFAIKYEINDMSGKAGVQFNSNVTNSSINANMITGIHSSSARGWGAAYGINFSSTGNHNDSIVNNEISDILTSNWSMSSTIYNAFGIRIDNTANNLKIYFNSVHLSGTPATGVNTSTSAAFYIAQTGATGLDIRNNVFSNNMTGKVSGSKHYALWGAGSFPGALFNYNLFSAASTQGILMRISAAEVNTLAGIKTLTSANANSIVADPLFNSDFILIPQSGSPLQGAGKPIPGVTTDKTNITRSNPPSIGAFENGGDFSGPQISYTRLDNTTSLVNFTVNSFASITDPTGVNTMSGSSPRIYYKKTADADVFGNNHNSFSGWKWTEANNTSSPFDFTIDYSLLHGGGVSVGDTIQYFVVAEDVTSGAYVSAYPVSGFNGTSVSAINTSPSNPDFFVIIGLPMTGIYTVGAGGTYPNLTQAATDITLRGLQGDVTLEIVSNTTEPGSVSIPQWTETGTGNYHLFIVPSASAPAGDTIFSSTSGMGSGILILDGADRVTIDGRIGGSGNLLTFINNTANNNRQNGIVISSKGTGAGATDNVIRNVNIRLADNTLDLSQAIRSEGNNNHRLQVLNNRIMRSGVGIHIDASSVNGTGNHEGVIIRGNTIGADTVTDYVGVTGIELAFVPGIEISQNHIYNIGSSNFAGSTGILLSAHTKKARITGNRIHDIINTSYLAYYGNYLGAGPAIGINLTSSIATDSLLIANNVIYRISNASYSSSSTIENPFGIRIDGGDGHQIIHNSVYLYGSPMASLSSGETLSAALMITNPSLNLTVQNNIFANGFTGRPGSVSYAIYVTARTTFSVIDNNNYDTTGAGPFARIGYKGSDALTMEAWRGLSGQDASSLSVTSGFTSTTDLTLVSSATPNAMESGGAVLTSVTTDFNNDPRPKTIPTAYGGNTAPDIGAYEFDGAPLDLVAPVISYIPIPKIRTSVTTELLQAEITDARSGVDLTPGIAPRIWYKKKSDANVIAGNTVSDTGWKYTEVTNASAPFNFVIDYSIINGGMVSHQDTIQYFVTAQDHAVVPNVAALPLNGFSGTSVSNITALPANPNFYVISTQPPLNGTYRIGVSGGPNDYSTITAALDDLALRGVSSAVTFELTDTNYSTAERFPLQINEIIGASAVNTVTIKPAPGVKAVISANSQSVFRIKDKVQYFIIDGSNNGTTSRDLLIGNSLAVNSIVVLFEGTAEGVKNSMVKNSIIKGGGGTTSFGVLVAGYGHVGIDILNNNIHSCNTAVSVNGSVAKLNNINVSDNLIGSDSAAQRNRQYGIFLTNVRQVTVNHNRIFNMNTATAVTNAGIWIGAGVSGSSIGNNTITGIYSTGSSGWGAYGINLADASGVDSLMIYNNMISNIITSNYSVTSTSLNAFGIRLSGGTNLKIYHNTVYLSGQPVAGSNASASAALLILSGNYSGSDIRNNIFVNSMTGVNANSKHYAFWTTSTAPLASTVFDYNNFYASGIHGVLMNNNGTVVTALANLKTATGSNANSQNESVSFVSSTDLHLISPSNGGPIMAGTPLTAVTTDIDNNIRSTSFPYMGAHEASIPLPVKLISFTATLSSDDVWLKWSTASETNNRGFEVQRSADGKWFEGIGFVNGKGNSSVENAYMFKDASAFAAKGVNVLYYRLLQLDKDGRETVSKVESVTSKDLPGSSVAVYPNPFSNKVTITVAGDESAFVVEITDLQGKLITAQQVPADKTNRTVTLDLEHLNNGVYFMKLNGVESKVMKLVKTN